MEKTTPTLPAEQEVKQTRVTTVSVRVKQELDTGYLPFLRYMQKTNWKNPPFGMRDATRATFEVWMSAEVGTDMTVEQVIQTLADQGHAMLGSTLRAQYPDAFPKTPKAQPGQPEPRTLDIPDEAYIIQSTEVETSTEEY